MVKKKKTLIASVKRIDRILPYTGGPHRAELLTQKKKAVKEIEQIKNKERRLIRKMPHTQSTVAIIASL